MHMKPIYLSVLALAGLVGSNASAEFSEKSLFTGQALIESLENSLREALKPRWELKIHKARSGRGYQAVDTSQVYASWAAAELDLNDKGLLTAVKIFSSKGCNIAMTTEEIQDGQQSTIAFYATERRVMRVIKQKDGLFSSSFTIVDSKGRDLSVDDAEQMVEGFFEKCLRRN